MRERAPRKHHEAWHPATICCECAACVQLARGVARAVLGHSPVRCHARDVHRERGCAQAQDIQQRQPYRVVLGHRAQHALAVDDDLPVVFDDHAACAHCLPEH